MQGWLATCPSDKWIIQQQLSVLYRQAMQVTHAGVQVEGGWVLNGCKRWIGNATFAEVVVVWARNLSTKQINAFVVRKGTPGFKTSKIENKIALRCVQNADIQMKDAFVPSSARLPGVNSFQVHVSPCIQGGAGTAQLCMASW